MKIICTKEEQARLVRQCYRQMCCRGCALYGVCDGENSIAAFVEDAPAVDAVEVVHARWYIPDFADFDDDHHYCSACNRRALFYEDCEPEFSDAKESVEDVQFVGCRSLGIVEFLTDYCPHCGAKMDGERRDDDA